MSQSKIQKFCSEDNCNKIVKSRGLCGNHYEQWRRGNRDLVEPKAGRWNNLDGSRMECFKPGCSKPVETQGLCKQHYGNFHYMTTRGLEKGRRNRKLTDYDGVKTTLPCTFDGCTNQEFNPGFCAGHYYQKLRGEEMRPLLERADCPVPGCEDTYNVKSTRSGVCRTHSGVMWRFTLTRDQLITIMQPLICSSPGCDRVDRLSIDHDHSCCPYVPDKRGRKVSCGQCVRGLLCSNCNTALGLLGENVSRIEGLLTYLENAKTPSK